MKSEYLLFNAVVAGSVLLSAALCPKPYKRYLGHALLCVALCALPYLAWDALVTDRHWHFNPLFVLDFRLAKLPLGEWLFFFTVPLATLFTWEMLFAPAGPDPLIRARPLPHKAVALGVGLSALAFAYGKEYTGLALGALTLAAVADYLMQTGLFFDRRAKLMALLVIVWTGIFNGYLTARPIVLYGAHYQLDLRVGTIPIEDFIYGLSLLAWVMITYRYACRRWPREVDPQAYAKVEALRNRSLPGPLIQRWVESRLGPYKRLVVSPDPQAPLSPPTPERIAVVGGGLAGMRAAGLLASRGFEVRLIEKADYLGGKIGAWEVPGPKGQPFPIEHGFHAFFPHYYNTQAFLQEAQADQRMRRIEDYLILGHDGRTYSYKDTHTTPLLNLFSLWRQGHFKLKDLIVRPQTLKLAALLRYDPKECFERYDEMSYATFAKQAKIPPSLALTFNSFSRAFFAPPEKMSMAELIKSFHFFFLGQDGGLLYDYPDQNYQEALIGPMTRYLQEQGVEIAKAQAVAKIDREGEGFVVHYAQGAAQRFDRVILACDVAGLRKIAQASPSLAAQDPKLHARLSRQPSTHPYAVWRIWLNRALLPRHQDAMANFVITDRRRVLDSVTFYDRFESHSKRWVETCEHPASVLELHSYCVPEDLAQAQDCKAALFEDLLAFFPELKGAQVLADHFALNQDFPAFFIGEHKHRPGVKTSTPGLYLAGDWVSLPHPAMLMEAATLSGTLAANHIFEELGLRCAPVWSVPPRGLLAQKASSKASRPAHA